MVVIVVLILLAEQETYGEAEYLADNYGRCALADCMCIKPRHGWFGRGCPHWRPLSVQTFEELRRAYG